MPIPKVACGRAILAHECEQRSRAEDARIGSTDDVARGPDRYARGLGVVTNGREDLPAEMRTLQERWLYEREYDLSSRHLLTARVLRSVAPQGAILDIGGSEGLTGRVMPERRVFTLDVLPTSVDVVASGDALPFADRSFAAAVALDVLEHVPEAVKEGLVGEAARVADVVVLAGPYEDPAIRLAEHHQREIFQELFGHDHPWLEEHAAAGLPSLVEVRRQLADQGFETAIIRSNPLELWSQQLANSHVALRLGLDEKTLPTRRWLLNHFLDAADGTAPNYRHIVVAARPPLSVASSADLQPGSDPALVQEAVRRTELSTASTIAFGLSVKEQIHAESMRGWEGAVNTVRELGQKLREAPDVRMIEDLEGLIVSSEAWRQRLSGPAVTSDLPFDLMPDSATYQAWRAARRAPDPPVGGPLFSIVTPVFNPAAEFLTECIRSVRAQTYSRWELILLDVSDAPHVAPITDRFSQLDDRIAVVRQANLGIAVNTNAAVAHSVGEWVVFLDHDDTIEPHSLAALALRLEERPECDFVYSDEDKLDSSGCFVNPFFKPSWSPDLLRSVNYVTHLTALRRSLFDRVGGIRTGFEGAQDYDFVLRATDAAQRVEHIPDVLYHWRQHESSTALDVGAKPEAHSAGRRALQDFVCLRYPSAWVEIGTGATSHRVRYPLQEQLVSIVIPFRDEPGLTDVCLEAIAASTPSLPMEVLLVSNQSRLPETYEAMERWDRDWLWARVLEFDEPFNFQRLNNWASRQATGELLLFLNNDTEPLHRGWLESLAENAQRPEIGAVGGRLFYPDGSVQHAGVAVGIGGFAEHPWSRLHPDAVTPAGPSYWVRDMLAVTAACLMVDHEKFDRINGFDERFEVCGGDVDLCLRLYQTGLWNVMTPFCRVVHREAATRVRRPPENDVRESLRAYAPFLANGDPFYNPNLTLTDTTCRVVPERTHPGRTTGLAV
jgi:GT2 family glycosyltransferase